MVWLFVLSAQGGQTAASYYAAPWAAEDGDGTFERPWQLKSVLATPSGILPGDTLWLRGGVYKGPFVSNLAGTEFAPIKVRSYAGEQATLEGCDCPDTVLTVNGPWTWYMGFEVRSPSPDRSTDAVRGAGLTILGAHTKFINLVVHDNNQGFSFWTPAVDAELYGNLVYYNGWDESDRGHGHGVYSQNQEGTKYIVDNVIFSQFSHGVHIYGSEEAPLDGFHVEGNVLFQNGIMSKTSGYARNLLLGGGRVANRAEVLSNYTYYPPAQNSGENNLGYRAGCRDVDFRNNYLVGGTALAVINCESLSFTGNFVFGVMANAVKARYPDNNYVAERPARNAILVRPNLYEPGRSHVIVYNWQRSDEVEVDLAGSGLRFGDQYELRSAEDPFGMAVSGTYAGQPIRILMNGWGIAQPIGAEKPASALPEFGVFLISKLPDAGSRSPVPPIGGAARPHSDSSHGK